MSGRLARRLAAYDSLLIGFSGGVDSALLAVAARRVLGRDRMLAVLGVSPSLGAEQRAVAQRIAEQFDLAFREVETHELDDPNYRANAPSRCYFCKETLWTRLGRLAREEGLAGMADGTIADDLAEHRPGLAAAREHAVHAPLAEAGYTKAHVRRAARALGIPIWNAPAAPCLASRVRYGLEVTGLRLRQVAQGEDMLRALGVTGDLRVRHHGNEARIEVRPDQAARVLAARDEVATALLDAGFGRVTLDLDGYRRGGLLHDGTPRVTLLGERA